MNDIFTVGYQSGWTPELLQEAAAAHDATVVDVRLKPWSKDPAWRKSSLERSLERYIHVVELGNLNYRNRVEIRLKSPVLGLAKVGRILERTSIILLCGCWDAMTCHRIDVAILLAEQVGGSYRDLGAAPKPKGPQLGLFT